MKFKVLLIAAVALLSFPNVNFGQAPDLGTAANFVLFTTVGAVTNTGTGFLTLLTGNVGSNSGSSTGFGNVNGNMDDQTALAATDLLSAYDQLDSAIATFSIASSLGNGDTLVAGVYSITDPATLSGVLTLDAQGDSNGVFIFQIEAPLSTTANSKVVLINGAQSCNVFWKVEGLVDMQSGTFMRGTIVAHNAAINMASLDTLEGRALSIAGAVSVQGVLAYIPFGCGSQLLSGPTAPDLLSTECYAIFTSDGALTNTGITYVTGDVGTNVGLTLGFDPLTVTGTIHPVPDASTAACAADLITVRDSLQLLPSDIKLLFPAQLGHNLVLTPHTYRMDGAVSLTDTLYLNSAGKADAVFVIQIYGAVSTSTHSQVLLTNGTEAKNVYWVVNGGVEISDSSLFQGTIVCNNGAIKLDNGVMLEGRALTTVGQYDTHAITATMPPGCIGTGITPVMTNTNKAVTIYPNPFSAYTTITLNDASEINNTEFRIYNVLGELVVNTIITKQTTTVETNNLPSGVYFYKLLRTGVLSGAEVQSGMLVSQQ